MADITTSTTRRYRYTHKDGVIVACALILLVVGIALGLGLSPAKSSAEPTLPSFSHELFNALNNTDVNVSPALSQQAITGTVSEAAAQATALAQVRPGSQALAAQLVILRNAQWPSGVLAWAIQINEAGGFHAPSAGPVGNQSPPPRNFKVVFVQAAAGTFLEGVSAYDAALPTPPSIPVPSS